MLIDYIKSLPKDGFLELEKEVELWISYKKQGMIEARQKLIEHYQFLVFREAMKYSLQETIILDLIQEGTVGLMEAVEAFDPERKVAFSLFAIHRIRGRMIDFLKKHNQEILVGMEQEEQVFSLVPAADNAFELADRKELCEAVEKAIARLPEKEQKVIRNVYLNEQTALETAEELSVTTAYVYQLQKRGVRRLRGMLSKLMHERK